MRKILGAAIAALVAAGLSTAPAFATSYPSSFSSPVNATIPVSCTFALPSLSVGAVTFIGQSDFDQITAAPNIGLCNVAFTANWTNTNGDFTLKNGAYQGHMKGSDNNGTAHSLAYTFTPPFLGGNAQQLMTGTFDLHIPYNQTDAYGGVTYSDAVILSIVY